MLRRCLFCTREFGENSVVESFSGAERIAFDPARGRLWAVCPRCGRWSLAPIETRWEVLETLEQVTRDRARLLGQTENIGLFSTGDAQIVRVGRASLREEAWWRYTREVGTRRKNARRIVGMGKVREAITMLLLIGVPIWGLRSDETWIDRARRRKFGRYAWRGEASCERCGRSDQAIRLGGDVLVEAGPTDEDALVVRGYCQSCGKRKAGRFTIPVRASDRVLKRSLAWQNFAGVEDEVLDEAVRDIERRSTADEFVRHLARQRLSVSSLPAETAIAFEIAVNEKYERDLLSLELEALEERWREEEEIAAIVDNELT